MLNSKQERELAYVVRIDDITPIEGYDRVELAHVGGWTIVVGKNEFHIGDPAIYFEIDSKLPEVPPFTEMDFLARKDYKIKTQKMCKSLSQGLLMSVKNFNWTIGCDKDDTSSDVFYIIDDEGKYHYAGGESRFLTQKLGVTYAEPGDNQRKASSVDKYKKMAQHHGKLFAHQPFRYLMKRSWGKKFLFLFFGKKRDKKSSWPSWVTKTDEERIQNMPWILTNKDPWIVTEKLDGTSTTFTMKRKPFGRFDFKVCSRNVVFDKPDKKCFYKTNVYTRMAEKYDIENKMKDMLKKDFKDCNWITIQGETYGPGIQNRDYSLREVDFAAFNFITSREHRWNSVAMRNYLEPKYNIPCVPIVDTHFKLPDTVDELLSYATGKSVIDGNPREGFVFRDLTGKQSFKAVSNEFLLTYHR